MIWRRGVAFFCMFLFLIIGVLAVAPADCPNGMKHYWKFDVDGKDSFNTANAVLQGTTTSATGKLGMALTVGQNKFVNFSSSDVRTNAGSYEFWFRISKWGNYIQPIFSKQGDFNLSINQSAKLNLIFDGATISAIPAITNGTTTAYYHQVVFTWASDGTVKLYLDGVLNGTATANVNWDVATDVYIGRTQSGSNDYMAGAFDELAFYNKTLTDTEVLQHYNSVMAGKDYCYKAGDGASSQTDVVLFSEGCSMEEVVGASSTETLGYGTCSSDRKFYCSKTKGIMNTLYNYTACSRGATDLSGVVTCCPSGFECKSDGTGLICMNEVTDCEADYDNDEDCNDDDKCYWLESEARCIEKDSLSCGVYDEKATCDADKEGLGYQGLGTEVCGTYTTVGNLVIPSDSCRCEWDGDECNQVYDIALEFSGETGIYASCSRNFSTPTECVNGKREVSWTATYNPPTADETIMEEEAKCVSGTKDVDCGSSLVKLPFFKWENFVVAFLMIFGIYFFLRR